MPFNRFFHIAISTIFIATCFVATPSTAQSTDEEVKSLGDILNPRMDYGNDGKPLTSAIMANHYFKTCMEEKSYIFGEDEKEILCGCTSAKMSETLTVTEFMELNKKTSRGREARSRMLAYDYAPCMEYVIEKKVRTDCMTSSRLEDIVRGKAAVCRCVSNRFKDYINDNAAYIIMRATHFDPMTLTPLEHYFSEKDYSSQRDVIINQCRYDFEYARDNKR